MEKEIRNRFGVRIKKVFIVMIAAFVAGTAAPAPGNVINAYAAANAWYSSQLGKDTLAKQIYGRLVKYYVRGKHTGAMNYTRMEKQFPFSASDAGSLVQEKESIDESVSLAKKAFLQNYPEKYWFYGAQPSWRIVKSSKDGRYSQVIVRFEKSSIPQSGNQFYGAALSEAISSIKAKRIQFSGTSRFTLLKSAYSWVAQNLDYGTGSYYFSSASAFGGDGRALYPGYADTFTVLCNKLGIPCVTVYGYANGQKDSPHAWNYVKMQNGKWYLCDPTWDDEGQTCSFDYFLVGNRADHTAVGNYPSLNRTSYTYDFNKQGKKAATKRIAISIPRKVTLMRGQKLSIGATKYPADSKDKVIYKSSKKMVASVSSKGVIRARKKGATVITVKSGKKKLKIRVTVK